MIETRRTCVISMARLTEETVTTLRQTPLADWPVMGAPMGEDMLMIWAPTDMPAHDLPPDLRDVLAWARRQGSDGGDPPTFGFDYVIFDRDKDPLEDECDLPIYGYDVPGAVPTPESILRQLIKKASHYYRNNITFDDHDQREDRSPTGDDFNNLMDMIDAAEAALEAI